MYSVVVNVEVCCLRKHSRLDVEIRVEGDTWVKVEPEARRDGTAEVISEQEQRVW